MTMPYAFLIEKYLFIDMLMNKRVFLSEMMSCSLCSSLHFDEFPDAVAPTAHSLLASATAFIPQGPEVPPTPPNP